MSRRSAHEEGFDYHCSTCDVVELHDTREKIPMDSYKKRYADSNGHLKDRKVTSGLACSMDCALLYLQERCRTTGIDQEPDYEEQLARMLSDFEQRLIDGE